MAELTILHNPRCSKSRAALEVIGERPATVVHYLKQPLSQAELLELLGKLDDEPAALVRRDPLFTELGLAADDVRSAEQVAALLAEHPQLMERPVVIAGGRAVIGRPTERVVDLLSQV